MLTGGGLNPGREAVPGGGVADGYAYLLNEDEEGTRPEGGTVNFSRGPQIVRHQHQQEDVGQQRGGDRVSVTEQGPAGDGSDRQPDRADEDEALVGRGIGALAERKENEGGENQHVRQRDDVEKLGVAPGGTGVADE